MARPHRLPATADDSAGEVGKANPLYEATVKLLHANLGARHPHTVRTMNSLSWMLST